MTSKNFVRYQPNKNDLKCEYGDCVVRAVSKALNASWLFTFDVLVEKAREIQCMPNGKPAYKAVLEEQGFVYHGISNKKGSKRPTVSEFARKNKEGVYVLRTANHLVSCEGGKFYDTWDSGDKCLYGYWVKYSENRESK